MEFLIQTLDHRPLYIQESSSRWTALIEVLADSRADDRLKCLGVIWALRKCESVFGTELISIAHNFAMKSKKYDSGWVERSYATCKLDRSPGLGSLLRWAKEDSGVKGVVVSQLFREYIKIGQHQEKILNDIFESKFNWLVYKDKNKMICTPDGASFGQISLTFYGKIKQFVKGTTLTPKKEMLILKFKKRYG